jgi:hypothetical protein
MTDLTNPIFTDADKARKHLETLYLAARAGLPSLWQRRSKADYQAKG